MPHIVYLALGTNLGNRAANLRAALAALAPVVRVIAESRIYETDPWGFDDQPAFLNMAVSAETELAPQDLLSFLKTLETRLGRAPSFRNGPRLIDMDILFYDDLTLNTPALVIPHPRLQARAFVLVPLADLALTLVHPQSGLRVAQLLEAVDRRGVRLYSPGSPEPAL